MNITRYKPQAIVTFYTETGNLVARGTNDPKSKMDDDIITITTSRDLGADAPTFSINLTRHKEWHKWVTSNDRVRIEMHRPPEAKRTVFMGLVDDVRKRVTIQGDSVTRVITITGRGFSKAFIQFDVGMVPEADYVATNLGWLQSVGITLAGSEASTIMQGVWDIIAKKLINYKFSDGKELFDLMKTSFKNKEGMRMLDDSSVINFQGSLWQFMKEVAEEPFHELYWDIGFDTELPELIMRPTPFNPDEWNDLLCFDITDEDVISDETGRSDLETYTLFSVGAKTMFSPQDTYKTFGALPIWYEPYSKKYGIRRLQVESAFIAVAEEPDEDVVSRMKSLMVDIFNWNIKNNAMTNGYLMLRGSTRYRVGHRLKYTSVEDGSTTEYYITSVSQSFMNFGTWVTTVGVTRGLDPKDRFTAPFGSYTEYSGMGLLEFNPAMALENLRNGSSPDMGGDLPMDGEATGTAADIVAGAKETLNNGINGVKVRYVFGGNSPSTGSLDCSSWTQYIFNKYAGIAIGRTTGDQIHKGSEVSKSNLFPGDLVLFKNTYDSGQFMGVSHVGIYVGDGKFIHNSSGKGGLDVGDLSNSYWSQHWLMGRRLVQKQISSGVGGSGQTFEATAYGAHPLNLGAPSWWVPTYKTATGTTPSEGRTIAVDPSVIPLHSKVRIESSYPGITGEYIAEDTGGAIKGNRIDIYFNDIPPQYDPRKAHERMIKFGRQKIKVTILRRGK